MSEIVLYLNTLYKYIFWHTNRIALKTNRNYQKINFFLTTWVPTIKKIHKRVFM